LRRSRRILVTTTPISVQSFIQNIGINTALSYPQTSYYNNEQQVLSALQYIGVDTIRNLVPDPNDTATWAIEGQLAKAGIKFDFLIPGNGAVDIATDIADLNAFEQAFPGSIASIEGPNEINGWPITYNGTTDTFAAGAQVTQALWTAVQSDPTLAAIPVYALSVSDGFTTIQPGETALGNLSPYVTDGNAHVYASGGLNLWTNDMPYWLPIEQTSTSADPTVVTETGYLTNTQPGTDAVDATVAAKYNLNTLFDDALHGIAKTFFYELADSTTSPQSYGFYDTNWQPKEGAVALHNLTTILGGAGAGIPLGSLNYTLSGLPSTGNSLLLGSTSDFDIAVWNDVTIWNDTTGAEVAAPTNTVTVNLGESYANVSVFDPMVGTAAIATYANVSSLQISLVDHPLIIQVSANSSTPPPSTAVHPSPNDTVIKSGSGAAITDANGNVWTITSANSVAVNGVTDTTTSGVALLAYVNGEVWQQNVLGEWYGRTAPSGEWSVGTPTSPLPFTPSANDTLVKAGSTAAITDAHGNVWTITGGAQLAINGIVDPITADVTRLTYVNGAIWQENSSNFWYTEAQPNDTWTAGTYSSPLPVTASPNDTVVLAGSTAGITDANGNVWTITAGGQVAINGVTDTATATVAQLAYVNGTIWQQNTAGLWRGETVPNDSWSATTPTAPMPAPGPVTGTGSDTLVLAVAEDYYLGNAQFTVSMDGIQMGGTFTATASNAAGNSQLFTFNGNWGPGAHVVGVDFLNDAYAGSRSVDRNVFVKSTTYDGKKFGAGLNLFIKGTQNVTIQDTTVPPSLATVPVSVISGVISASSGNHTFLITGHADTFNLSGGVETITDSGSGGNTFNLPAAGNGSAIFNAATLANADVLGLQTALAATQWTGSAGTLSSFLHTAQSAGNTQLLVSRTASGSTTLLATFNTPNVSLSTILAHAIT
jgi:hypothetical protein